MATMMDLIAAGNTQPGGFYNGGGSGTDSQSYGEVRSAEANGFGLDTMKLFRGFVEQSMSSEPVDSAQISAAPHQPYANQRWHVTEEMMHQPWGKVLRTLQPRAANELNPTRSHQTIESVMSARRGRGAAGGERGCKPGF